MVSSFSFVLHQEYLELSIQGTYDYWEFLEYPKRLRAACDEHQCDKALVDLSPVKAKEVALIELFFLGEEIARELGEKIKLALIWKRESLSDFLVDVATNRNANLKVFDNPKMAAYWLTHKY
jgi:hypothetical protein